MFLFLTILALEVLDLPLTTNFAGDGGFGGGPFSPLMPSHNAEMIIKLNSYEVLRRQPDNTTSHHYLGLLDSTINEFSNIETVNINITDLNYIPVKDIAYIATTEDIKILATQISAFYHGAIKNERPPFLTEDFPSTYILREDYTFLIRDIYAIKVVMPGHELIFNLDAIKELWINSNGIKRKYLINR